MRGIFLLCKTYGAALGTLDSRSSAAEEKRMHEDLNVTM